MAQGTAKPHISAGCAGEHRCGLKAFHQLGHHGATFDKCTKGGQSEIHHRGDDGIQRLRLQCWIQKPVGFQVERAGGVVEQISVFHDGNRGPGTGAHLQPLMGGDLSWRQGFHGGEAQAFNHARCGH